MNRPKYPVVMVWWLDASANNDEMDDDDILLLCPVHTYGELSYEDEDIINITPEHFPSSSSGRHKTVISKDDIIKIYTIDIKECYLDRTKNKRIVRLLKKIGGTY